MHRVAAAWDQRPLKEQQRIQNIALRQTILQMALGHVPFVRNRLGSVGLDARLFKGLEELQRIPLSMRRDIVDPRRNPEGTRSVILRGTAEGVKRFSDRSVLTRIALARLFGGEEVQELAIEAATRAIHIHLVPGPGGRIPVAYTRDDLDLLARAGARLARLVGLERTDRLLNLVPFGPTLNFWGIYYMAHGVGISAVHMRRQGQELVRALEVFDDARATAIAIPADEAAAFPAAAAAEGIDLSDLRSFIAVGRSLTAQERASIGEALLEQGATHARIAAAYAPGEGHVLWGECSVPAGRAETFGFHTFSDMDLVEIVDPETGTPVAEESPGEIVVTPLGFRGGGVPRWRTGDLALGGLSTKPCPNCGRLAPRVGPSVAKGAWQRVVQLNGKRSWIDLRDAGAAAAERARLWQVELLTDDDGDQLFVYLAAGEEPQPIIDLYEDLNRLRAAPTQVVLGSVGELEARRAGAPGPWPGFLERRG
jgi:phenylacetate-coenzyme A ligase PaaK-like adenylate-forming protein